VPRLHVALNFSRPVPSKHEYALSHRAIVRREASPDEFACESGVDGISADASVEGNAGARIGVFCSGAISDPGKIAVTTRCRDDHPFVGDSPELRNGFPVTPTCRDALGPTGARFGISRGWLAITC